MPWFELSRPPTLDMTASTFGFFAMISAILGLLLGHRRERDALRALGEAEDLADVLAGQEALGHLDEEPAREDENDGRHGQDEPRVSERWPESPGVETDHGVEPALGPAIERALLLRGSRGFRNRLQSMGVSEIDTKPEIRIATPIVTANSWKRRPTIPPMKSMGMKTAASEIVIDRIVKPISFDPLNAASHRRLALLHVADDVLEHDDGVVDDEADRQREGHQREVVQAEPEQVHDGERADDRERQSEARDDRRREVPQEEEDDHDDERERQKQREPDVVDGLADRDRAVEAHAQRRGGGQLLLEGREKRADRCRRSRPCSCRAVSGWRA